MHGKECILYHDRDKLRVGSVFKYSIEIKSHTTNYELYVNISNRELSPMRAAYLNGPFTLYADIVPMDYSEFVSTPKGAEPRYENTVKAGANFIKPILIKHKVQKFMITVVSELLFARSAEVGFDIVVANSLDMVKITGKKKSQKHLGSDQRIEDITVTKYDTLKLWQQPLPANDRPLHLCVITHGLVSNVTADMLYMKEAIDRAARMTGENLICKGFTDNVCKTERGVKYLGKRLAHWIVNELIPTYRPRKMSFLAHSLGGLVQTYALGYIQATRPEAFKGIQLENFIALASPFLGISNENPGYVQFVLDFGFVGKTGRDLGLSWSVGTKKPLLQRLPNKHTRRILRRFVRRTVYANAVNDGIVPLRTGSILYLDWRALSQVNDIEEESLESKPKTQELVVKTLHSILPDKTDERILKQYQTKSDIELPENINLDAVVERLPKKTSIIESGMSLLLPPHPDTEFITEPATRSSPVFQDRVYFERDLPPRRFKSRKSFVKNQEEVVEIARVEEIMARKYHHKMSWRKVLVKLQPEAHNNIIVRRRFSNAYGWPVVHHAVTEHFLTSSTPDMYLDLKALAIANDNEDSEPSENDYNNTNKSESESKSESEPKSKSKSQTFITTSTGSSNSLGGKKNSSRENQEDQVRSPKSNGRESATNSYKNNSEHDSDSDEIDDSDDDMPWSESEDDSDGGPVQDPHRSSMFKIIRSNCSFKKTHGRVSSSRSK